MNNEFMLKVFGESSYDEFKQYCQEEEKPIAFNLQIDDPENWNLAGFRDFAAQFRDDTGLELTYINYVCPHCNALHVVFEVNESEEEE